MALKPTLPAGIGVAHCRRLRAVWRSAGWPCQDLVEVELLAAGVGRAEEIPPEYGVMLARDDARAFEVARAAPKRAMQPPLAVWMALARANAEPAQEGDAQGCL